MGQKSPFMPRLDALSAMFKGPPGTGYTDRMVKRMIEAAHADAADLASGRITPASYVVAPHEGGHA